MKFDRFKKVVVRDFHNTCSLFGISMLIIMLVPAFVWLMGLAVQVDLLIRRNFVELAVFLTAAISSMKIFGSCNLVGKGNYFAMLPASLCEKFTSMALYCFVVCPLVVFVGSVAVDTILTLLPFGPYKEFLWQVPDWMNEIGDYSFQFATNFGGFVLVSMEIFAVASLFMLANTIFKKNKFIKTVLWLMLIAFVLIIIFFSIVSNVDWWIDTPNWLVEIDQWFGFKSQESLFRFIFWCRLSGNALVTFIFSFIAYRRLKKMQY